ncbi:hypothetical protein [Kitasatospora sp. NPDC056731]|uniref:hypothetical protein n=1 Tax=Kitasatospora sp. NPDC056731 TaxID=3155422 RepID=UPI00343EF56B
MNQPQPEPVAYAAELDRILASAGLSPDAIARINAPRRAAALTVTCPSCSHPVTYRNGRIARHTRYGTAQPGRRTPWCASTGQQPTTAKDTR